ncbi:hypothetical protein ABID22_000628 [Pontibacter aydingkolensis]|uniref:Uncharacterized protein n=1 Tax=Pontibacter aydingkolensis TaxID=1911536 RepID=A0ABS7CRL7_9BACT|nr:hypothetical protein [Pontibacter aydingkolensis]MBW7466496.1 hypothetical protein [Pontibacter aydingkolensis]
MRSRTLEKLLYKAAILLVIIGAFVKFIHSPDSDFGLYLILAGHVAGVAAILLYMKYENNKESQNKLHSEEANQYENN